jgi:hypothetical protein
MAFISSRLIPTKASKPKRLLNNKFEYYAFLTEKQKKFPVRRV